MFTPDTPIPSLDQDGLNRAKFAQQLAQTILDWDKQESMVIALYGPWGSGKTSVMNMIVDYIVKHGERAGKGVSPQRSTLNLWPFKWQEPTLNEHSEPLLLKFNPWFFSGQSELLTIFFAQLLSAIERTGAKNVRNLREQLTKYSAIASAATAAIPVVGGVAVPVVGEVIKSLGPSQDLSKLRADIDKAFKELGKQVIILIDDVDRLSQDEIRQIFRLIKLNADFPNTVYIIAADRKVLVESLSSMQGISGQDYLEKIVQVGFDIPIAETSKILELLTQAIGENIGSPDPSIWNQERWSHLFHSGFKQLFTTLRGVKRYVNSLAFNYQMVTGEVNPIDFIGIEAIRVFDPEVYTGISNNKAVLCSGNLGINDPSQPSFFARKLNDQELRDYLDKILGDDENIRQLCMELFPEIRRAFRGASGGSYGRPEELSRQRRICSPDIFAFYFVLGIPQGEVSRAELLNLNKTLDEDSLDATIELLHAYINDQRIRRLLELSEDVGDELSAKGAANFAASLVRIGETIPEAKTNSFKEPAEWVIMRVIWRSLEKLTQECRIQWFQTQMEEQSGSHYLISLVSLQRKDGDGPLKPEALFDEQTTVAFQAMCVERIRAMAAANTLLTARNPNYLLSRWAKWDPEPQPVSDYIATLLGDLKGALEFLKLYMTIDLDTREIEDRIRTNDIAPLIGLSQIDAALTILRKQEDQDLPEELQKVLEAWDRSYQLPALNSDEE